MIVICYGIVVIEYGRRRAGLYNEPLYMEYYSNRDHRGIAISLNITT